MDADDVTLVASTPGNLAAVMFPPKRQRRWWAPWRRGRLVMLDPTESSCEGGTVVVRWSSSGLFTIDR